MTQHELFRAVVAGGTIAIVIAGGCSSSEDHNDQGAAPDGGEFQVGDRFDRACRDGIDNDADGLIDYPDDPGCSSRWDDSEDTDSPTPPPDAAPAPDAALPPATGAANVDTSRMPVPPKSNKVINITSPITISGTVTDVTYNVTGSMPNSTAITLGTNGRLERVRVNVNGRAYMGVSGGTLKDVYVSGAVYAGIVRTRRFEGVVFGTNSYRDFYLTGSGVTMPANAMIKSANTKKFSFYARNLTDSRFDGAIVSVTPTGNLPPQATAFECWSNCQRNLFNIIISDKAPGYGLAIYGGSADNVINEFLGVGNFGDPGISMGGGAMRNVIHKATVRRYTVGVIFGEDVNPPPHHNTVHTLIAGDAYWGCVFMDRGAYNNVVGDVGGTTCVNTGGADSTHHSSVWIANRPGQTNTPPRDNKVLGLVQSGQQRNPRYSVFLGSGTTRNTVSGKASYWATAKVRDQGSGNSVNVQ